MTYKIYWDLQRQQHVLFKWIVMYLSFYIIFANRFLFGFSVFVINKDRHIALGKKNSRLRLLCKICLNTIQMMTTGQRYFFTARKKCCSSRHYQVWTRPGNVKNMKTGSLNAKNKHCETMDWLKISVHVKFTKWETQYWHMSRTQRATRSVSANCFAALL